MQKHSILDVWRGSEHVSAEKQGTCKVCFFGVFVFFLFSFLVFRSRRLYVTFDIQIDLKMKHS